jgi:TolA-binding protein
MGEVSMGQITRVTYGRLTSFGRYENERIGADAAVAEGESPDQALATVTAFVEQKIAERAGARQQVEQLDDSVIRLQNQMHDLEYEIGKAKERYETVARFMAKHGLKMPGWLDEVEQEAILDEEDEEDEEDGSIPVSEPGSPF